MLNKSEGTIKFIVGIIMYLLTFYVKGKLRGWKSLSKIYVLPKFKGAEIKSYKDLRLRVNDIRYYGRYNKAVNLKVFEEGIELQKILPLQMKNFAIFIKWEDIIMVKKRNFIGISTLII